MHTNDMHAHFLPYGLESQYTPELGDDPTIGGIARIATLADQERAALAEDATFLMYDAGDYSMGTLFSLLGPTHAPELMLMDKVGYSAVTFGNHEFDFFPAALAASVNAAMEQGLDLPLVASNLRFDPEDPSDDSLEALVEAGTISELHLQEYPSGLKVGVFGVMGEEAASVAPNATPCTFEKAVDVAREVVPRLREMGADLVVCLSHSGTNDAGFGPDRKLAQFVPDIDILVSGHSHTVFQEPQVVGKTLLISSGSYTRYVGRLRGVVRPGEGVEVESYELVPVDDSVAVHAEVAEQLEGFITEIDTNLLGPLGLAYRQPVAHSAFDLTQPAFSEGNLGDLITDASLAVSRELVGEEVAVAVESGGVIRDELPAGTLWVADLFRALPLGIGPDGFGGYPLISFYVTGADMWSALEVLTIAEDLVQNSDFFLAWSGVRLQWDPAAMPFARITEAELGNDDDGWVPLDRESEELHRITVNIYNATLLSLVEAQTGGLLKIIPRDAAGEPLAALPDTIIDADPDTEGLQELKQWLAFVQFLGSFEDVDGDELPDVPERYREPAGRITQVAPEE